MWWAFAITDTFWSATRWWADKIWQTRTRRRITGMFTLSIGTAWRRYAWIICHNDGWNFSCKCMKLQWWSKKSQIQKLTCWETFKERVTCIQCGATTYWIMVYNLTLCTKTTCARAWVYTFLIGAGITKSTFIASYTLGSTSGGTSIITRHAGTYTLSIKFPALTVGSARWWITRTCLNWSYNLPLH